MYPELTALISCFIYLFFISTIVFLIIENFRPKSLRKNLDSLSLYLLVIGGLLIVFSIISPSIILSFMGAKKSLIKEGADTTKTLYEQTGPLGDTLGGVMNPFIALAGVIITGLAFYAQFNANKAFLDANEELKKQFKLQQFESQFYEMLSLHKENVNEMVIEGYEYDKNVFSVSRKIYDDVSVEKNKRLEKRSNYLNKDNIKEKKEIAGRKIFYLMLKEFHAAYELVKKFSNINSDDQEANMAILKLSYNIFFSGKVIYEKQIDDNELSDDFNKEQQKNILNEIEILRICHKKGVRYIPNYIDKNPLHIDFSYKPFGGHIIRFAHFYRHMYAITNFVVNENNQILTYEDKRKYLKMFRAQLSNHEITLLYYNWLAGHGDAWELKGNNNKEHSNKFFTDYRMVHNLNAHLILKEFSPVSFFKQDIYRNFMFKPGKKGKDGLFELYDMYSKLSEDENEKLIGN